MAVFPLAMAAQTAGTLNLYPSGPANEQAELNQAVGEANGSRIDLTRGLEQFLLKYPNTARRGEIEATLYKTAIDSNDRPRTVLYGEKLLAGKPAEEMDVLDHVIRALLGSEDTLSAVKALAYTKRYESLVEAFRARTPEGHTTAAQWADLGDRSYARAAIDEARAVGNMGHPEDAVAAAQRSWLAYPTAESAHEIARWLVRLGRESEAIDRYLEAATIADPLSPWSDRDRDRKTASALYVKIHGSEQGLGDLFLQAWDRSAAALRDRVAHYKTIDRNYGLTDAFQFILPAASAAPNSASLDLATLKGKTLVVDFWATWCGPCVAQHPLIEHVKQKYEEAGDVVFLSLNADDDHSLVEPFMKQQKWEQRAWLESGLAGLLNVSALPTIVVIEPSGKIYSRMTGLSTDLFERMLSTRIDEARAAAAK